LFARGQEPPRTVPRQLPEALNFANGLLRDRRYESAAEEYERFLQGAEPGPDADEARFGLANARLFQGQYDRARRAFEAFLQAAPNHPNARTAWYRIGEISYLLGDLRSAQKALETFTTGGPGHRHLDTAWPYLGDVCLRLGDLAKARNAYEQALTLHAEGPLADRARLGLGRTLALQKEPEQALKTLAELAEKGGRDWAEKAWVQIGQIEAGAGHLDRSVEAFETLERVAPQSALVPEARLNRAEVLVRLDRRPEAEGLLRGLLAEAPQNLAAQAALVLGTSQLDRGQAAEALATLDEARKRFPKSAMIPALWFRSAEAALKQGKADEARARFLKAAEADPKDPWADDALLRAARLALETQDFAGARALAASFPGRFPDSALRADARLIEGRAALGAGQNKDAIAILGALLAEDKPGPETAQVASYQLSQAYRKDGQTARADEVLSTLARSPAAAPVVADAQYMLGQGHIEARRFAEAVPALQKYLTDKPDGEVADYALAHLVQAHLELGQPDAAEKALARLADRFPRSKTLAPTRLRMAEAALAARRLDRAAELFPLVVEANDPALKTRAQSGIGWVLLEQGHPAEAAAAFAALLEEAPNDPLAPDAALARGRSLEAARETDKALAAYARVAESYPKTDSARLAALARARLLVETRHPAEAAEAYARLVEDFDPKSGEKTGAGLDTLLAEWGWALVDAEKTAEADHVFNRLLSEFPDSPRAADARFNLAESANHEKDYAKVVALLTPVVAEGSKATPRMVASALYRLGRTQARLKDWPASARTLDRLITEFPDNPLRREARFLRAEVALESDDPATAEAGFQALESEPAAPGDPEGFLRTIRRRRIQSLVALKEWEKVLEAADAFKADAGNDPQTAEVEYARGRALQSLPQPRFDEARAAYQKVIDARRGGDLAARAQLMRGETYFHQKNYPEAKREFLKVHVLYHAPTWQAAALLEAGKVCEQLSQWKEAADTYEELRSKFPDDPNAEEARRRLEAVQKRLAKSSGDATTADAGIP
jgi:TolA-binding protein